MSEDKPSQYARGRAAAFIFLWNHGLAGRDELTASFAQFERETLERALAAMPKTSAPAMDQYQSSYDRGVDAAKNIIRQLIEE